MPRDHIIVFDWSAASNRLSTTILDHSGRDELCFDCRNAASYGVGFEQGQQEKDASQSVEETSNELAFNRGMIRVLSLECGVDCVETREQIKVAKFGVNMLQYGDHTVPGEVEAEFPQHNPIRPY